MRRSANPVVALLLSAAFPLTARAQDPGQVEIRAERLADGVFVLFGQGGNIGLSVGSDGAFLIDDQYAPLTARILEAVRGLTPEPVRFVFNTHWHGDHTGGNENLGRAGVLIVAHDNVRRRMSVEQVLARVGRPVDTAAASPPAALPVVTFSEEVTFHLNGDELHAFHVANAHTDTDAIVHFRRANVVHMGDTYFKERFPFIDTASGGSIDGLIAAVGQALAVMDADTRVIPGHGTVGTREDLRAYRDALKTMRDRVARSKAEGATLQEVLAARPASDFARAWGQTEAAEQSFVETIWVSLGTR